MLLQLRCAAAFEAFSLMRRPAGLGFKVCIPARSQKILLFNALGMNNIDQYSAVKPRL
jgi:hypothetical protein